MEDKENCKWLSEMKDKENCKWLSEMKDKENCEWLSEMNDKEKHKVSEKILFIFPMVCKNERQRELRMVERNE